MGAAKYLAEINLPYTLQKLSMRVALLDPERAASKLTASEMTTWMVVDDGLEGALLGIERALASAKPVPRVQHLLTTAKDLQSKIRRAIAQDELGQAVDFAAAAEDMRRLASTLEELREI